jgi:hypothetical protein
MMVHISVIRGGHLHHDGAFYIFHMLIFCRDFAGILQEAGHYSSLAEPRGSARLASFSSSESVIVGNTLPSEVSVPQRR